MAPARKHLKRRESVLEDSCMPSPLDPSTLPHNVIALRSLLLQREAEHAAEMQAAFASSTSPAATAITRSVAAVVGARMPGR
jgi:hypothetical protein